MASFGGFYVSFETECHRTNESVTTIIGAVSYLNSFDAQVSNQSKDKRAPYGMSDKFFSGGGLPHLQVFLANQGGHFVHGAAVLLAVTGCRRSGKDILGARWTF